MIQLKQICGNCTEFDPPSKTCAIRYTIYPDKSRKPMARTAKQKACPAFLSNLIYSTKVVQDAKS